MDARVHILCHCWNSVKTEMFAPQNDHVNVNILSTSSCCIWAGIIKPEVNPAEAEYISQ